MHRPSDVRGYDNSFIATSAAAGTAVKVLSANPKRTALVLTRIVSVALATDAVGMLGYMEGSTFVAMIAINNGEACATAVYCTHGPAIMREIWFLQQTQTLAHIIIETFCNTDEDY